MSVARVTEITATSPDSFEAAIRHGLDRATSTLHGVKSAWIKEQEVMLDGDKIAHFKVNMMVTFILDD